MKSELIQDLVVVLPMSFLFLMGLVPPLIKVFRGNQEPNPLATLIYGFIGLVFATGTTAVLEGGHRMAFSQSIVLDGISVWASCLIYFLTAVGMMLAYDHVATRARQFAEFCFLLIGSAVGMVVLIMSNDLIVTFIGIETMSLCLYILIAMNHDAIFSKEAAFKYFVLGSFASAIFLYGIALIYGTAGTTYYVGGDAGPGLMENFGRLLETNRVFVVGVSLVVLGFAFKVALFPFHAWAPDVYQGASTPVTAFMATAVKAATFVAFLRVFDMGEQIQSVSLLNVLTWIAVLTMLAGNIAAIMQDNFKRLLAYSSVAHSGYAMVGLIAAAFGTDFNSGASSLLFYLFSYAFMTIGAFAIVAVFEKKADTNLKVSDLKGLARKYPVLGLCLTVLMLSLAGIPPTLGFFGKFYIFTAAIEQDMYWLAFWGVISSVISVYYYLRPVGVMYMGEGEGVEMLTSNLLTRMLIAASALIVIFIGIFSSPAIKVVRSAIAMM